MWVEIKKLKEEVKILKERVTDLENEGIEVMVHEALIVLNSESLEQELSFLMNRIRKLTKKFGKIQVNIISD